VTFLVGFAVLLPGLLLLIGLACAVSYWLYGEVEVVEGLLLLLMVPCSGLLVWGAVNVCIAVGEAVR